MSYSYWLDFLSCKYKLDFIYGVCKRGKVWLDYTVYSPGDDLFPAIAWYKLGTGCSKVCIGSACKAPPNGDTYYSEEAMCPIDVLLLNDLVCTDSRAYFIAAVLDWSIVFLKYKL